MEGVNILGVCNVIAGQYLFYLAYRMYNNPDVPAQRQGMMLLCCALFVICGIGLIVWGVRRILTTYREYRDSQADSGSGEDGESAP